MDNLIEMTFEEADEQFKFILNSYDIDASFDGLMYETYGCLLYTSPSPRDRQKSRMPSSA